MGNSSTIEDVVDALVVVAESEEMNTVRGNQALSEQILQLTAGKKLFRTQPLATALASNDRYQMRL